LGDRVIFQLLFKVAFEFPQKRLCFTFDELYCLTHSIAGFPIALSTSLRFGNKVQDQVAGEPCKCAAHGEKNHRHDLRRGEAGVPIHALAEATRPFLVKGTDARVLVVP
jgi:hypothetical protein